MRADFYPSRDPKIQGRSSVSAQEAPRHVAIVGADTPVGVHLLALLGRSPLVYEVTVLVDKDNRLHEGDFWPRKARPVIVDMGREADIASALRGARAVFLCQGDRHLVDTIAAAARSSGVQHLSAISSSIWGTNRNKESLGFEKSLKDVGLPRLSLFRPRLLLDERDGASLHAKERYAEAQDGLARLIAQDFGVTTDHRQNHLLLGLNPVHTSVGMVLQFLADWGALPPPWAPIPAKNVARAMWLQSCWKKTQSTETYESITIAQIAEIPEAMSRRWEQSMAEHVLGTVKVESSQPTSI